MWIFTSNSFLSIVAHKDLPDVRLVRARKAGDIEKVFPDAEVWTDPNADYHFRALVPKQKVAVVLAAEVLDIEYGNFKSSVPDEDRLAALHDVWGVMQKWGASTEKPSKA